MNKNHISGYPSPGETSQATDYGDINFDQILNDHYIDLPKSAAAQAQFHTKKMTLHKDTNMIPSPFPAPSPARSSYSPPPHKTPNLPSSSTRNNSGGNKSAVRDIMDEFYSVMQDIQDSTGVLNPVPYAASKIDVDYDLIKATTRSSFVNNVDVIEETHRMYHEYESDQSNRQPEESGFWPPWKAPIAQPNPFIEEKKGGMPSLVSSLENTQQWRRNIEIDESDEEDDMERQFEKNAAMEEELLSGIGGLTAIPIMTTTYHDEGRNTEPSTQFHSSSTSRYFSKNHSHEDVGVEEEDESEVFVEAEAESNNNESENADLSEEMIDEMLFLPNSVNSTEGIRSSKSKSLRFSENNDENEEDSTLPVGDGHPLEMNQEKADKRSLLREIEANLPQSRSRRLPSQRSPSSSVSQSQSTYATTEIFQSSGLQYDENIPSIQHFSTLPLALQEIEKLNRIKESLLDALYDTKQQLAHTQDTVTQEKEKNYELTTLFEIEKENQRLQTLSLQQQIRILTQEHSIQEIYQIYEKDLQRLKQENERLYDRNLTLELQYEASGVVPPSQVTHSPGKSEGNSAQRQGGRGRVKVAPTSDEDEMRQIEREEKHIQQIQHASDVLSVRKKEEGEGRRGGKEGILKPSSDGGDPSSQLTVTTYEYQQLLKRYHTLIQKYKQCAIEKQSWKQSYETLKSQDRKHHLHEKLYTDLQLRHKKISYEYQQMKQIIDKQSQQLLEKQKDYHTIIHDYNELKRDHEIIKKEQSEYLMKIQQATKVIYELREEKTRLTHFYQFLYKHQAKGLITSLSPPVIKDLQNMSIDDVLEREEREEDRKKKRDTVRMKDDDHRVNELHQSHSRKGKKEVFGKNYQLALQNFYKYYNDDMTMTKIPTPSSLQTMATVKSEIAKNMASEGMMGLGNASDKENHQFLRTMETERSIQISDGRKGGGNNRIATRVEPRSYSTKYSNSPSATSTPTLAAPKSWKK